MTTTSGAPEIFAETIREIRELIPDCRIEVLIPDFQGLEEPLKNRARRAARCSQSQYRNGAATLSRGALRRALRAHAYLLENAKKFSPGMVTKSGVMVGLGESIGRTGGSFPRSRRRAALTFLPWASICAPRAITCRLRVFTRLRNFVNCGMRRCALDSATLNLGRWCDPAITRTSRLNPRPLRGSFHNFAHSRRSKVSEDMQFDAEIFLGIFADGFHKALSFG